MKVFSLQKQMIYVDVYVEDKAKRNHRTLPDAYSIAFSQYKSVDPHKLIPLSKSTPVIIFTEPQESRSKNQFMTEHNIGQSQIVITVETIWR